MIYSCCGKKIKKMKTINLNSVLPQVFAQQQFEFGDMETRGDFEKGHLYLIEADSGMGKEHFCSYITLGYRHDYSGNVTFDTQVTVDFKVRDWVEVRKSYISHLFQELRLFPELSAFENVEIKNKITVSSRASNQIVEWFDMLGIGDKLGCQNRRMSLVSNNGCDDS